MTSRIDLRIFSVSSQLNGIWSYCQFSLPLEINSTEFRLLTKPKRKAVSKITFRSTSKETEICLSESYTNRICDVSAIRLWRVYCIYIYIYTYTYIYISVAILAEYSTAVKYIRRNTTELFSRFSYVQKTLPKASHFPRCFAYDSSPYPCQNT